LCRSVFGEKWGSLSIKNPCLVKDRGCFRSPNHAKDGLGDGNWRSIKKEMKQGV